MRLVHFLIGKSILEALFVAALAVVFYVTAFNTNFRGWSEMGEDRVAGWVVDESAPYSRVEVQLYVDDRFVTNGTANVSRPDVAAAGRARDEWHGFQFELPPLLAAGEHVARVYAVHESGGGVRRTLQVIGKPVRFVSGAKGKEVSVDR